MLNKNQKNFILGLITIVVIVLLGLLTYSIVGKNDDNVTSSVDNSMNIASDIAASDGVEKLVLGMSKDQYLNKWCTFNSQDPEACTAIIQKCVETAQVTGCDSLAEFEESWANGKDPDAYASVEKKNPVDQAILASFCEDNSGQEVSLCVKDMNECFAGTSKDQSCKDYIRHFNSETDGGKEYGDLKAGAAAPIKVGISSKFTLQADPKKVEMGSCNMGSCSYSKIIAKNILDSNDSSVTVKAKILGGTTEHADGSYPKNIPKNIQWNNASHDVIAICSYSSPSVILNDQVTALDFNSIARVDESAAELYFEICHNNFKGYPEASKALGYI